jgi:hypothetical protein
MSASNWNPFITYLFAHEGIDPQNSRPVSDFLHLTTEADILQITDAKLLGVPGLSAVYRMRIVGAVMRYRRAHGLPLVDVLPSSQSNAPIQTKEEYTSSEIQEHINRVEAILQSNEENHGPVERMQSMKQQLDSLRADLILKKQEEKVEMQQLLRRLLQMVELM